ncbi:hypothetical protein FGADI_5657 [Fusarium gaditjirri]|uniref:Protein kinase domain-containing protein n=1 Tax=Fusarium gaditjirri TaxID=282569 RepID=A0A8H4T9J4_9HYPO|nr:hypothetical protein FGADI_5657 [Fusarium gaditjirri]
MKGKEIHTTTIPLSRSPPPPPPPPGECHIALRNVQTIQGALLRGDEHVDILEWPCIPPEVWCYIERADNTIGKEEVTPFIAIQNLNASSDPWFSQDARHNIENKRWRGMKFKFIRVLARGGHGYVSLWDVVFDDKSVRRVVIKRAIDPLTNSFDTLKESQFHLRYDGAQHTTQVIDLHREAVAIQTRVLRSSTFTASAIRQGKDWNAEEQKCVVFEYMKFGDIVNIMQTVAARNAQFPGQVHTRIPDQVLWGIWECLVLGLATIAYTPSNSSGNSSFETWWKWAQSDKKEALAFLDRVERQWQIEHDVHLDLEVLNVLAGHDPTTHPHQPVFKLHDLGAWSFKMNEAWESQNETQIWMMRGPVKLHGMAPEQFSKEWDKMPIGMDKPSLKRAYGGEDLKRGNRVAGRFGMWTNIFLVARVMESVMTGVFSKFPYQAVAHDRTNKPTYGGILQTPEYDHIDFDLRETVKRCLYEKPKDRPTITKLLENLLRRKEQGFNDRPEFVDKWWKAVFEPQAPMPLPLETPPPASPVKQAVLETKARRISIKPSHTFFLTYEGVNIKYSVKFSSPSPSPSLKHSLTFFLTYEGSNLMQRSLRPSPKPSIKLSPNLKPSLKANVTSTGLEPSIKFIPNLSSLKFSLEPSLIFFPTYEGVSIKPNPNLSNPEPSIKFNLNLSLMFFLTYEGANIM